MTLPWLQAVEAEFAERLAGGRLAHALLLSGPQHCGKTELARAFMAAALCLENRYPACGRCRSCQLFTSGAHPDGHVVTFEEHPKKPGELRKELVIAQVRRLTQSLFLTNTISARKAALVYPVEESNIHTLNALLKTLEEPPGDAVLILVSHNPGRLPATIRSRCQNLVVRLPAHDVAVEWVMAEASLSAADAAAALEAAAGRPLQAVRMARDGGLEQYRALREKLAGIRTGRLDTAQALAELGEVEPERLWSWVSLLTAALGRESAREDAPVRAVLELQRQADVNRRLVTTPVRKDLLLQDWLIQWARLGV